MSSGPERTTVEPAFIDQLNGVGWKLVGIAAPEGREGGPWRTS